MKKLVLLPTILLALAAAVFVVQMAGAQGATRVDVALTEFKVSMTKTTVPVGVPITFVATNKGATMHEVVLERAGANDEPLELNGVESEIEKIAPGDTKSATWTITEPGVYQLACHVPGHFDAGMVELFTAYTVTGGEEGQVGATLQAAAPSAEDRAEGGNGAAARLARAVKVDMPATLPSASVGGVLPLWFLGALAVPIVAAFAAFLVIVRHIGVREQAGK